MRQHLPGSLARTKSAGQGARLPIASLRSMCLRFGVSWAAAYTLPNRTGSPTRHQLLGRPISPKEPTSEAELQDAFTGKTKALIPFEHLPTARATPIRFGFLALERENGFSRGDIVALRSLCSFAAAYIFEMTEAACLNSIANFRSQIGSYDQSSPSGTKIVRLLNNLHRCTRAHVTAYVTISGNDICLEYKVVGSSKTINIEPQIFLDGLPPAVLATIVRREVSVWSDLEDKVLTTFFSGHRLAT